LQEMRVERNRLGAEKPSTTKTTDHSRREFLKSVGRWMVAPLLAGGVLKLASGSREQCAGPGVCNGCGRLTNCHLPQAVSTRSAMRHQSGRAGEQE